ncbi:MAG: hypothetical protein ACR2F2_11185 [Pyrinomonadaceae bacterium]
MKIEKLQSRFLQICLSVILLLIPTLVFSQNEIDKKIANEKTRILLSQIVRKSYPELADEKINVKTFESEKTFFKARFSITRFLTFRKLNYIIFVNPVIFKSEISGEAVSAILAHELAHILYYDEKNRFELIGLASLTDKSFTAKFERKADLQAIRRGYGAGLIKYREWLYANIPKKNLAEKKRDYFSPDEIKAIMEKPEKIDFWLKNVPRNLSEIK